MTISTLDIPIDFSEAAEAAETIAAWAERLEELPDFLRAQIERMAQEGSEVALFQTVPEGPGVSVLAVPELRALIGNLRAREAA